jgi:hypothetical protein
MSGQQHGRQAASYSTLPPLSRRSAAARTGWSRAATRLAASRRKRDKRFIEPPARTTGVPHGPHPAGSHPGGAYLAARSTARSPLAGDMGFSEGNFAIGPALLQGDSLAGASTATYLQTPAGLLRLHQDPPGGPVAARARAPARNRALALATMATARSAKFQDCPVAPRWFPPHGADTVRHLASAGLSTTGLSCEAPKLTRLRQVDPFVGPPTVPYVSL